jgi:hypothetical protein
LPLTRCAVFVFLCGILFAVIVSPARAAQTDSFGICSEDSSATYDDVSGIWSPCATPRGSVLAEATYLQNASSVGGTALAAYPMLTLRTGVLRNVEFVFDSPSQIAESGLHGIGLYPKSHLGYGLRYTAAQTQRTALAVVMEVQPQEFQFSPNRSQSRYVLGFTSEFAVSRKLSVGLSSLGTASAKDGVVRILPSSAVTTTYSLTPTTQLSTDLGTRIQGRKASAQSFSDVSITELLRKNLAFKLGLGTTFNSSMNTKPHYLAAGFNYRL